MLIVVTGASGFIGGNLRSCFAAAGHDVIAVARPRPSRKGYVPLDPDAPAFVEALARGPDVLVHAAGSSLVGESFLDPPRDFRDNTSLYLDVLQAVRQYAPACGVMLVSSAAVYGEPVVQPAGETTSLAPISPYGHHKMMAEQLGQMYHDLFGLRTCALRVFSAYGRGLRRQVVYDAIRRLREARPDQPAVFRGTGQEARDFVHVQDVAQGALAVMQGADWAGEAYNLASGASTTIAELVENIRSLLGGSTAARFDGAPTPGNPLVWQADISRIRRLGFAPAWTLTQGLADIVEHWDADNAPPG